MIATLWIPFTLLASVGQVARNALQRSLTQTLGTIGATHVRFLFGLPFAGLFLLIAWAATPDGLPRPTLAFWPWLVVGAMAQIVATALMLAAMTERSFVVTTAYLKTEPVLAALFGSVFLNDVLSGSKVMAIAIATAGVVISVLRPGFVGWLKELRPTALGLSAAALFGLSAVGFRGAILALTDVGFVMAATATLAATLLLQTVLLTGWLAWRAPDTLTAILRAWTPSLFAGFTGAAASQFWFLAFALAPAASVRTLALVEVVLAQAVSVLAFQQRPQLRELVGVALILIGVGLLIAA